MQALNRAEAELALTTELSERRDELSRRYGQARLDVYHWEEAWRTVKACHRFLHRLSPLTSNQIYNENELLDIDNNDDGDDGDDAASDRKLGSAATSELTNSNSLESLIGESFFIHHFFFF